MLMIDASVWVNAYSPAESDSQSSRKFLDRLAAEATVVVVPTLLRVEVAAAITRTRRDAILAIDFTRRLAELPLIRWISLDPVLAEKATALAANHGLRGADAVYAATALAHGCDLISLDREHLQRLTQLLTVRTPSQFLAVK